MRTHIHITHATRSSLYTEPTSLLFISTQLPCPQCLTLHWIFRTGDADLWRHSWMKVGIAWHRPTPLPHWNLHTHTHTHTHRERVNEDGKNLSCYFSLHTTLHTTSCCPVSYSSFFSAQWLVLALSCPLYGFTS